MVPQVIDQSNTIIEYDRAADVLYISFGETRPAIAVDVGEGDLVRIDPFTDEIVGITLLDFKDRYPLEPGMSIFDIALKIIPQLLASLESTNRARRRLEAVAQ